MIVEEKKTTYHLLASAKIKDPKGNESVHSFLEGVFYEKLPDFQSRHDCCVYKKNR